MNWKPIVFRIIGAICFAGGLFAFYDYGREFFPLFQRFVGGTYDVFEIFTLISSLFFGALALTWVGIRMMALRTFSNTWIYAALLPVVAWVQNLYAIGLIFKMDRILSLGTVFFCIYILTLSVALFVKTHWFTPLSHEALGHVGIELPKNPPRSMMRPIFILVVLGALLALHPADIGTTLRMLTSPIMYVFELF